MSNKIFVKFVVAFGVLAMLLIFLGLNFVTRISALSSAKENAGDVAKYASPDWIERHSSTGAKPMNNVGPDWIERHLPTVAKPMNYVGPDWIERHLPTVAKPMNYAGAEATGVEVKIAPVFDTTGAVVSDPTGMMLHASQSGDLAVPVMGTGMKISPVFDTTGVVVSDPTGTMLRVINP